MWHVRMQHAGRARVAEVDARVDVERGLLDFAFAFEHVALGVEREQVRGSHLAPVQSVAIQKEALAAGEHDAEVVADAFVQVQAHREPERRREIDPHRPFDAAPQFLHRSHGADYKCGHENKKGAMRGALSGKRRTS
jgi:hypothetical protein